MTENANAQDTTTPEVASAATESDTATPEVDTATTPAKALDKMTLAELRDYAASIGIEKLPGKSKADAVKAIRAATIAPSPQLVDFPQPVLDVLARHNLDPARVRFTRHEYGQLAVGYLSPTSTLVGYRLALTQEELTALVDNA